MREYSYLILFFLFQSSVFIHAQIELKELLEQEVMIINDDIGVEEKIEILFWFLYEADYAILDEAFVQTLYEDYQKVKPRLREKHSAVTYIIELGLKKNLLEPDEYKAYLEVELDKAPLEWKRDLLLASLVRYYSTNGDVHKMLNISKSLYEEFPNNNYPSVANFFIGYWQDRQLRETGELHELTLKYNELLRVAKRTGFESLELLAAVQLIFLADDSEEQFMSKKRIALIDAFLPRFEKRKIYLGSLKNLNSSLGSKLYFIDKNDSTVDMYFERAKAMPVQTYTFYWIYSKYLIDKGLHAEGLEMVEKCQKMIERYRPRISKLRYIVSIFDVLHRNKLYRECEKIIAAYGHEIEHSEDKHLKNRYYDISYQYYKSINDLSKAISNLEKSHEFALENKLESFRKNYEFNELESKNKLLQTKQDFLSRNRRLLVIIIAGLIVFIGIQIRQYMGIKKTNLMLGLKNNLIRKQKKEMALKSRMMVKNAQLLEEKNNNLKELTSIIAHDLRKPVMSIMMSTRAIQKSNSEDISDYKMLIQTLSEQMKTIFTMSTNILNDNLNAHGDEAIRLSDVFQKSLKWFDYEILNNEFEVEYVKSPCVFVDQFSFQRVFQNLISNSISHAEPEDQLKIRLSHRLVEDGILYTYSDNGTGMNAESKNHLLSNISNGIQKSSNTGYGIGMLSIEAVLKKYGSTLEIEFDDRGSHFSFLIPDKFVKKEVQKSLTSSAVNL